VLESTVDRSAVASSYAVPRPFVCSWRADGLGAGWVRVAGELDLATSWRLRASLEEAQQSFSLVVLDLRELSFLASSGVHVILDLAAAARRNDGWLLVVRGAAQVDRTLTLTDIGTQLLIFDLDSPETTPALSPRLPNIEKDAA
jgi:anti-sigma B factor antagonist